MLHRPLRRLALALLAFAPALGCGGSSDAEPLGTTARRPSAADEPVLVQGAEASPDAPEGAPLVVFLGDSLTAGYGLPDDQAYPALLEARLAEEGAPIRVVNAGVSGDTSAGGLRRLDWLLRQEPDVLVVGLGANDGLRGLDLDATRANLRAIVSRAKEAGVRVLLLGMKLPPNYGEDYTRAFARMYTEVAEEQDVALVPFLLEGVGGVESLNQADGIHPTAEGQRKVADNVLPHLEPLLR